MILTETMSNRIVTEAYSYLNQPFDYHNFNCVHFIRKAYKSAGIEFPILSRKLYPPKNFNLSDKEFLQMPLGQCTFFKRKATVSDRIWTHVAIIFSSEEMIHCTRHFGNKVTITAKEEFLGVYQFISNRSE